MTRAKSGFPTSGLLAATSLAALTLAGCAKAPHPAPSAEAPPATRRVTVAAVRSAGGGESISVPGVIAAGRSAMLSPRIPATIVSLPLREGESFAAGAVVARLDDAALRSALTAAESSEAATESDLRRLTTLQSKGAATAREVETAAARAAASRAAVLGAKSELGYAVLRSPWAGVVARLPLHVGDMVSPGTPVVEIESQGDLEVRSTVEAELTAMVTPGKVLAVRVDGQPSPLSATVRSLSPSGDPSTHRFELRATLPAGKGLRSGLFARIEIPGRATDLRLMVPAAAVFARGGLTGLFVVEGGQAKLRFVAVGDSAGGEVEVRAGVAAGERVVIDPAGLVDGNPVEEARG